MAVFQLVSLRLRDIKPVRGRTVRAPKRFRPFGAVNAHQNASLPLVACGYENRPVPLPPHHRNPGPEGVIMDDAMRAVRQDGGDRHRPPGPRPGGAATTGTREFTTLH